MAKHVSLSDFIVGAGTEVVQNAINSLIDSGVKSGQQRLQQGIQNEIKRVATQGSAKLGGIGGSEPAAQWPGWFTSVLMREGGVFPVLGARDTGKSTACVSMAEYIQKHRDTPCNIFFPGYPPNMAPPHIIAIPESYIANIMHIAKYGDVVILDDAYRWFASRRSMKRINLDFMDWVNSAAHNGVNLFINLQDSSDLEKAGLRADAFIFKPPERMFEGSERKQLMPIIKRAQAAFDQIPRSEWVKYGFVWVDPERNAMVQFAKPEWMTRAKAKYRGRRGGDGSEVLAMLQDPSQQQGGEQGRGQVEGKIGGFGGTSRVRGNPFGSD